MKRIISVFLTVVLTMTMSGMSWAAQYADDQMQAQGSGQDPAQGESAGQTAADCGTAGSDIFDNALALAAEADENGVSYDGFMFKLKDDADSRTIAEAAEAFGDEGCMNLAETGDGTGSDGLYTAETVEEIAQVVPEESIEYIEPDYVMELMDSVEPDDPYYESDQWNLAELHVSELWASGIEGQDLDSSVDMDYDGDYSNDEIVIAVVDSGLDISHEDIDSSRIVDGWNFVDGNSDVSDDVGHGTFVCGILAAVKDNGIGIAGIGSSIKVMPLKAFSGNKTSTSTTVKAIEYAVQQKELFDSSKGTEGSNVCVINISFGGTKGTEALQESVESAIAAGIIVVCAAGNDGTTDATYPAQYAIGVGAYTTTGGVASFSQRLSEENGEGFANKVWVSAPGATLISTADGSYSRKNGTSFACPQVSALAAICKGLSNNLNHNSFKALLKATAVAKDSGLGEIDGQDIGYGWGCVDYHETVTRIVGTDISGYEVEDGLGEEPASNGAYYYYKNGSIDFTYTGLAKTSAGWLWVADGRREDEFVGFGRYNGGIFLIEKGKWNGDKNGLVQDPNHPATWYYCAGSQAQTQYTGLAQYDGAWFYIVKGELNTVFSGLVEYDGGKFIVAAGQIQKGVSGLWQNSTDIGGDGKWYYFAEGQAQTQYTGLAQYDGAWFYIEKGVLAEDYTGFVKYNGSWFYVQNGMLTNKTIDD